jgi:hypothetical protein
MPLSSRDELEEILFRSPTVGELEKQDKKSSIAKNLAIGGAALAALGGGAYLMRRSTKQSKEIVGKVKKILEDELVPTIREWKRSARNVQDATKVGADIGRLYQKTKSNLALATRPKQAGRIISNRFEKGLKHELTPRELKKGKGQFARFLGRKYAQTEHALKNSYNKLGVLASKLPVIMSARDELSEIIEFRATSTPIRKRIAQSFDNFWNGTNAKINPATEQAIRKVGAHPAAKMAGYNPDEIIEPLNQAAKAQAASTNRKIAVWGMAPPVAATGIGMAHTQHLHNKSQQKRFSARDELSTILFNDPRPRNSLGMFSGGMDLGPNPQNMKIVYDPRRLGLVFPTEQGLTRMGKPLRRIMRR